MEQVGPQKLQGNERKLAGTADRARSSLLFITVPKGTTLLPQLFQKGQPIGLILRRVLY